MTETLSSELDGYAAEPDMQLLHLAMSEENIVDHLDDEQVAKLAQDVVEGYEDDEKSMADWQGKADKGLELARMVTEEKTYPWPGAANAKYPLIAQAALQYNARVYPALVPSGSPVHVKVWGQDEDGAKQARASRVREFMGFQTSISDWEEGIDRLTISLPIVGAKLRKVFYDPVRGLQTKTVERFVLNNNVTDFDAMPRISEEFELYPHEIEERIRGGRFVEFDYEAMEEEGEPHVFIEQHCRYDLDEDGYPEPYIVTVHKALQQVVRVVGNFDQDGITDDGEKIVRIEPTKYYVAYNFVPSMDGTFLGIGLGHLLCNSSELINTVINQILDSGHLASLGGGFLGTGLNLKGGAMRLKPGEFKPVGASGQDIRTAIVPMQFPGPNAVLFQMLGLLIDAGKDVSAISDVMTGDAPRQQTATTTLALIEQGMAVFTAAYKRLYRSLKKEFGLMCRINAKTVDPQVYSLLHDPKQEQQPGMEQQGMQPGMGQLLDPQADFTLDDLDIQPVADPAQVTNMQKMAKAQLVQELAMAGLLDPGEATMRVLEAAGIQDTEKLMPQPDPMQQAQEMLVQALQTRMAELEITKAEVEIGKTISETHENRAQAVEAVSSAQAERESMSLNDILRVLDTLAQFQGSNETGRSKGMAGASGNGAGAQGSQGSGQPLQAPDLREVLAVRNAAGGMGQGPGF